MTARKNGNTPHGVFHNRATMTTDVWWEDRKVFWVADAVPEDHRRYAIKSFLVPFLLDHEPDESMVRFLT
jgi:hypothetical protein